MGRSVASRTVTRTLAGRGVCAATSPAPATASSQASAAVLVFTMAMNASGLQTFARPKWLNSNSPIMVHFSAMPACAVLTTVSDQPGVLFGLTKVLADRRANISYVDIITHQDRAAQIYLEFSVESGIDEIVAELGRVSGVDRVELTPSFSKIYGKRIIIMGGGAQVGQVALGAIAEADRHNIRGERISVDTIPLVGEEELASAVRAVVRLPRVRLLVLAGSLMGGDISRAVEEVRQKGLIVISLNQAGSVPDVSDLVVSDPVQAGVMAVMAIADTAKFDIVRQQKRRY
jgi:energy-converting hydrogenase B subunit Q